jgi:6-phosphofructokinase 1
MVADRATNDSRYSVCLVSEGAMLDESSEMTFEDHETDMFGHKKLGGIGDLVSKKMKDLSPKYNNGKRVNVINQRLGYMVRSGDPDSIDSIVPMAYGNLALDLILDGSSGRLVTLRNGRYDNEHIEVISSYKKVVDVDKYYNVDRLRPHYKSFETKPLFIMASD